MSARKPAKGARPASPAQTLHKAAAVWENAQDHLSPVQVRQIEAAADRTVAQILGSPSADYVAGMIMGASLQAKLAEQSAGPLAQLVAGMGGGSDEVTNQLPILVASCLAARILAGDYEPRPAT